MNEAHRLAILHKDPHLRHLIADEFLHDQIEEISSLIKYRAHLKLVGEGLGVLMFEKELQLLKWNPVEEEEKTKVIFKILELPSIKYIIALFIRILHHLIFTIGINTEKGF